MIEDRPILCAEVQHFRQSNSQGDDELVGKVNKHVEERSFPQIDEAGSVIDHDEGALVRCHEAFGPRLSRSIADNGRLRRSAARAGAINSSESAR